MAIHRKILRWLENELFEGNIQLGQDLPTDSEIARAIGVGRSRTRDALRTLEDMDLVQLYSGRGKEMLVHLSDEPAAAASAALRLHMSSSRYPTRDLVQTRILLESWAIARIDPKTASFAEMDEVLAQMEDFDLSIRDFLELLLTFHHQVMRCAGNELLVGLLASVRQPSFESMLSLVGRMPLWSSAVERLRAESRAIAEALKAGDAATARALVIGQLRGMYSEAGIDLEQEATSANGLPGEPEAAAFAPVELEDFEAEDLLEDFDEAVADDPSFSEADVVATDVEVSTNAVSDGAQPVVELPAEEPRSESVALEEASAPAPAEVKVPEPVQPQPARPKTNPRKTEPPRAEAPVRPAHSVSADVPLSFGTPHPRTVTRAPETRATQAQTTQLPPQQPAPVQSVGAPWQGESARSLPASNSPEPARADVHAAQRTLQPAPVEEPVEPAKVLRAASGVPRRRSGQIVSPVRATILKPVDRSRTLVAPSVLASRSAEPVASAGDGVLRAPSRESVEVHAQRGVVSEPARSAAPQVREVPSAEPSNRLEAAATLHDTYEMLPHEQEQESERRGLLSKMKRFFGVDVYEPASRGDAEAEQASEPVDESGTQEKAVAPDAEALARAEAERAERLKAFHAVASEGSVAEEPESAAESAEAGSVESLEPVETSDSAETSAPANAESASSAHASGSALSKNRSKGSKKSKKKRR